MQLQGGGKVKLENFLCVPQAVKNIVSFLRIVAKVTTVASTK